MEISRSSAITRSAGDFMELERGKPHDPPFERGTGLICVAPTHPPSLTPTSAPFPGSSNPTSRRDDSPQHGAGGGAAGDVLGGAVP